MKPRVFFGTMHSGEAEFEECTNMIHSQLGLEVIHHELIEGLSEKDAHNKLWTAWERAKHHFDLFVKVDADTILIDKHSISRVWSLFEENSRVTGAQLRLQDFFTGDMISGLNFFSPVVKFNTSPDLYCDRVDTNHDVVMKGASVSHLEPIGYHCMNPNDNQAFHFGLHRMLKGQASTINKVWNLYVQLEHGRRSRELTLLGAALVMKNPGAFGGDSNTYTSDLYRTTFELARKMGQKDVDDLLSELVLRIGRSQ